MFRVLRWEIYPAAPLPAPSWSWKSCVLCWHWWELSTAAAFGWAGSMPPLANRSPSGQSGKLPHPAGSFRKQGHGWVPERGLNREAEAWAESRDRGRKKEDKMFPAPREEHRLRAHLSSMLPCSSRTILYPCPLPATSEPSSSRSLQRPDSMKGT